MASKSKDQLKYNAAKTQGSVRQPFHFFATSAAEWKTSTDLEGLIKTMKSFGYEFSLYRVPLPEDDPYEISMFRPMVPDTIYLGSWSFEEKENAKS